MDFGTLLMVGGGAIKTGLNWYGASAAIKQSKYKQDVYEWQARYVDAASRIEEAKIRRDVKKVISAQRAGTAASGFQADTGTPLELQIASEMEGDLDIELLRMSGGMEKLRLQSAGDATRAEGYGIAAGLYARATATSLDPLLAAGQRHGWFKKKAPTSPGGLITAKQPQRLRWRNP